MVHVHRPDGKVVFIAPEHIVSVAPAEQSHNAPGHRSTIYLVNGQFREVQEDEATIERLRAEAT